MREDLFLFKQMCWCNIFFIERRSRRNFLISSKACISRLFSLFFITIQNPLNLFTINSLSSNLQNMRTVCSLHFSFETKTHQELKWYCSLCKTLLVKRGIFWESQCSLKKLVIRGLVMSGYNIFVFRKHSDGIPFGKYKKYIQRQIFYPNQLRNCCFSVKND